MICMICYSDGIFKRGKTDDEKIIIDEKKSAFKNKSGDFVSLM